MSARPVTWASALTAEGRGAVAVVLVEGPAAVGAVDACFRAANGRPLDQQPKGAIRFGRWLDPDGEEVVVVRKAGGPWPAVEVHCHGGAAAVRAVLRDLAGQGCVERAWEEALPTPGVARATVDAQLALRHALTERTAGILLDQADGALERRLHAIAVELRQGRGVDELRALLRWADVGRRLTAPWRVVLAGAPNVGKSSLINALLGYGRAIVFDQPGTTRDVLTAAAAIKGWPLTLSDTAGLRASDDPTEAAGVELARQMLESADLVIDVRDATTPRQPSVVPPGPAARRVVVWNKRDLAAAAPLGGGLCTSATTGQGVAELMKVIARTLVPQEPAAGQAMPVTAGQRELLMLAEEAARGGDLARAEQLVQSLLAPTSG